MPPVPTAKPDGPKIHALIRERGYSVTDFARRLARHPQSIWVITGRTDRPVASKKFIRQIARELGVRPSEISDMEDDDDAQEPEALAS
jgi:IS30 family transposase